MMVEGGIEVDNLQQIASWRISLAHAALASGKYTLEGVRKTQSSIESIIFPFLATDGEEDPQTKRRKTFEELVAEAKKEEEVMRMNPGITASQFLSK